MSLRSKLLGLLALSVGLAVAPYSFYTAANLKESYQETALGNLRNVSTLVRDNLGSRYLAYLTGQVVEVMRQKENLRKIGLFVSRNWEDLAALPEDQRRRLIGHQVGHLSGLGLLATRVEADGRLAPPLDRFSRIDDWAELRDFTGRSLKSRIEDTLSPDGEFLVFSARLAERPEAVFLALLLPQAGSGQALVIVSPLTDPALNGSGGVRSIVAGLQARFQELRLPPQAGVSLLNGRGAILAHQGAQDSALLTRSLLDEVRRSGELERVVSLAGPDQPKVLLHLQYFKPLDWFIALSVPEAAVSQPARAVARHMLTLGFLIMGLALSAGFYFATRLTSPLKSLSLKALDLAAVDFSSPGAEAALIRDLPRERPDEVGRLSAAFRQMGQALIQNVRELMAATAVKERLEGELGAAREIQLGILPSPEPWPGDRALTARALLRPAKEVGGDLYDFFTAPDGRRALVIGDVSDKGVPSALFMAMTVTLVRQTIMGQGLGPAEAMTQVNARLYSGNPGSMFVTLFIGLFDPADGTLEYANGGHCQPLVVRGAAGGPKGLRTLEGLSGPLVGALDGWVYIACHDRLEPGEICLLYTDGITEAQNEAGGFFEQSRLETLLRAGADLEPAELNQHIYDQVLAFRGAAPQSDDITLVSFTTRAANP